MKYRVLVEINIDIGGRVVGGQAGAEFSCESDLSRLVEAGFIAVVDDPKITKEVAEVAVEKMSRPRRGQA